MCLQGRHRERGEPGLILINDLPALVGLGQKLNSLGLILASSCMRMWSHCGLRDWWKGGAVGGDGEIGYRVDNRNSGGD